MQESMHANLLAAATLPSSAASTPTAVGAEHAVNPLAPCEGPFPYRASARSQRHTTQPVPAGLLVTPSRLAGRSAVPREEQSAAGPSHAVHSTVQPRFAGGWFGQAGEESGVSVAASSSNSELGIGNGRWDAPASPTSNSTDPWSHPQHMSGSQSSVQQSAVPLVAEPYPQRQAYRWHQQPQLEPQTWQQQQQGWNYGRTSGNGHSIRDRSHSPRGRRRQHQQRMHQRSNGMGASRYPQQQWQQQITAPSQQYDCQLQQGQQALVASQLPGHQPPAYQQLHQQQQQTVVTAVDPWQSQQQMLQPPPPPAWWHHQMQQQQMVPWHQQLPQQQWGGEGNSSSSNGGNWPPPPGGDGTAAAYGAWAAYNSSQQGAVAGSSAAAAAAPPRHDPNPTQYEITGLDPFPVMYHQPGHQPNLETYQGLGSTSLIESAAASGAAAAASASWPAAVTQEQQPQQQQPQRQHTIYNLQSHMLSQLETDSSEEPEEWFSVTNSPAPLELQQQQQQQQGTMVLPTGSNRLPQTLSQGVMLPAATRAPALEAAIAMQSRPAQQQSADHSHAVVQDQRRVADSSSAEVASGVGNTATAAGEGGSSSSSSSRFDDVSSDGDSDLPELIPSPGYAGGGFYAAADPSGAWLVPPPAAAAAAAAGATDGSGAWPMSAQQQQQQGPARQVADAWVVPQLSEQDPVQNSWPPQQQQQQQQQQRLGSIDELQPTPYGPRSVDGSAALLQAAAAATGLDQAAAAQQDRQPQQLWLQEQQLLEQQLQQLEAEEAAVRSSSPSALASWRAEELYRLAVDARGYMALGAAEDDGDSTAATAADSSSIDAYPPPPAAAAAAAGPLELPQLARVRTAAVPAARSGASLEDSPNAQMAQLMRRLQQQYDMLQQQQYTAAQLEFEQQQILNRYGLAVGARGHPRGAGSGGSGNSSNATAAGAPYRPLVAAAAAGPGSSAAVADRPAADRDNALLRQLLDSASSATQEVDATAMAALAGSFEQQRQWRQQQWRQQQQQQQAGVDLAAQWDFSARRRRGLRHVGGHGELPHALQHPAAAAAVAQQLTDPTSDSQRASIESLGWQDSIPPLLDADPALDGFEGLTPSLSPHRPPNPSYRPQNPGNSTALYPNHVVHVSDPAQPAHMLAGSSAAAAAGVPRWLETRLTSRAVPQGQDLTPSLFGPGSGYLLPAPMGAAAAGGGQVGPGTLQQQQQLRLQVPPPGQLVLGRWSSSSGSSSGLSPLISPAVTTTSTSSQHDVAQTPTAAMLVPQQAPNAPRRRQQRQPLMALQQQQQQQLVRAAPWPDYRQIVYGPYSGSSSAAATAGSAAGVASAGPVQPPMFTPGPGGSNSSNSGWQQLHGVAASMPNSGNRSGGIAMGQQSNMQVMMQNFMINRNRHAQASAAAAAPAAVAADQATPAAAAPPIQGIWPLDPASNRAFEQQQQQWQRDLLLAMQLDQPPISVNPLAPTPATAAAAGPAAAAAAARQRQSDLQRLIQQARASISPREGGPLTLTPMTLQQSAPGQGHMGTSREYNVVDASGLVAGAGPGTFRPDLMVRMMRLMNLDEAVMLPRIIGGGDGLSYEQLIGLEDVRVVVPAHVLRQLPRRSIPKEDKPAATDAESVICTICQCELAGQELVVQLPCKHDYHEGCVCEWLSKYKKTCPVCKAEVRLDT